MENVENVTEIRIFGKLVVISFKNQPFWFCIVMTLIIIGGALTMLYFILPTVHASIPNDLVKDVGKIARLIKGGSP